MKVDPRPWGERILIRRHAAEEVSKGGIILPEATRNPPAVGTVLAIGPEVDAEFFRIGSTVLFQQFAGAEVELNNEKLHILSSRDVFLRLDEAVGA